MQVLLCVLLLALFSPVVLAVGSAAFRPDWLTTTVDGVPISVLCILLSIVTFIVLTWAIAIMAFARLSGPADAQDTGAR